MKARLVHVNDSWHLLLCTGDIKVLKASDALQFILNFDDKDIYSGSGKGDPEDLPMEHYRGETVAVVTDDNQLYIQNSKLLRSVFSQQDTKYLTISEYAKLHEKQPTSVRRMCQTGRIDGAIIKGKTWLIPASSPYPKDERIRR